jgi:hypothetical protein
LAKRSMSTSRQVSEYKYVMSMGEKLGEYVDEWIAVVDNKIIARGKTAKEVYEKAKEYDASKTPFIMRVPTSKVMVL